MKRSRAGILVVLSSIVAVVSIALVDLKREPPGPVSAVHGQLAAVDGGRTCSACHGGWFGNMQKACLSCHEAIATQFADKRGVHGSLGGPQANDCSRCHGEHHGDGFRLVNRLAFAQAGLPDVEHFEHSRVGFPLRGKHAPVPCRDCHRHADVAVLAEGQQRYLGLAQDCGSCHDSPHGNRMQLACTTCHDEEAFANRAVPTHARYLPLTGVHGQVACRECHAADSAFALEAMAAAETRKARQCGDCHESPHAAAFVAATARDEHLAPRGACAACHDAEREGFGPARDTLTADAHARSGFPLAAPHDKVECKACHRPELPFAERFPGRTADACAACHQDPHGGQFAAGPFAGGCIACHDRAGFKPHGFDRDHHARTALPLDGAHKDLQCDRCHAVPPDATPRQFAGTPARCEDCHADAHDGGIAAAAAAPPRGTCAECHRTTAFAEVDTAAFAHGQRTGFPLAGAHAQSDCASCHEATAEADARHRRFGRATPVGTPFAGCVQCHEDVHKGAFDKPPAPADIDGRTGCERCHDSATFRVLAHGFAHDRFTGFPLIGRHAELQCTSCHPIDPVARTRQPAKGTTCSACHDDVHRGQFARLGETDCARCHKSATAFAVVTFRHNVQSRFNLGDQHVNVACGACHKQEDIGGATAVRYKPLPTACVDCHGNENGPGERGRKG